MEHEGRGLPETEPVPPSARRRMLKKSKSLLVAGKLASAKKWVKGIFVGKGGEEGREQGKGEMEGEGGEGDGKEEEERGREREVGTVVGHRMTSRGRMEGYF